MEKLITSCLFSQTENLSGLLFHRQWKDVGLTHPWMRGMTSGGTNLPAAKVGVTRTLWCKCSDTGEGAVKKREPRFKFQGKYLRLEKRKAGGTPERGDGLGRSARSRRVRAAPGFTTREGGPRTERGRRVQPCFDSGYSSGENTETESTNQNHIKRLAPKRRRQNWVTGVLPERDGWYNRW